MTRCLLIQVKLFCQHLALYSEFQYTQNFSILRISAYSEFQYTQNFSILRISVYSEFQYTQNFSILIISAYSEFQYTQNFSILSVSLKFEIFDSDSEVSRVHSEVTVPPNFCHSPEAPSQTWRRSRGEGGRMTHVEKRWPRTLKRKHL
jgi:hypothetical protein